MRHKPTQNHSVLVGLMLHHSHDDYEYWRLDISKEDQDAIFRILEKYDTSGSPIQPIQGEQVSESADIKTRKAPSVLYARL